MDPGRHLTKFAPHGVSVALTATPFMPDPFFHDFEDVSPKTSLEVCSNYAGLCNQSWKVSLRTYKEYIQLYTMYMTLNDLCDKSIVTLMYFFCYELCPRGPGESQKQSLGS